MNAGRRKRSRVGRIAASLGALALSPVAGSAQQAQLGVYAGRAIDELGEGHPAFTIAPAIGWDDGRNGFGVGAQATLFRGDRLIGMARGAARVMLFDAGMLGAVMGADASATLATGGYRALAGGLQPSLRIGAGRWSVDGGAELAVGSREARAAASPVPPITGERATAPPSARTQRGWRVAGRVDSPRFGVAGSFRSLATEGASWTEGSADAALAASPITLAVGVGARFGAVRERWAQVRLLAAVAPRVRLTAEAGRSPSSPLTLTPGGRYVGIGLVVKTPRPNAN